MTTNIPLDHKSAFTELELNIWRFMFCTKSFALYLCCCCCPINAAKKLSLFWFAKHCFGGDRGLQPVPLARSLQFPKLPPMPKSSEDKCLWRGAWKSTAGGVPVPVSLQHNWTTVTWCPVWPQSATSGVSGTVWRLQSYRQRHSKRRSIQSRRQSQHLASL